MLIGGDAIGTVPLGGVGGAGGTPAPEPIPTGVAFTWRDQVVVAGEDMSDIVSGEVQVDRERGAAAIADFYLFMADDPNPLEWVGREVAINYISTAAGETTSARRFTGRIEETTWNPLNRLLACACSDQLQQKVERLTVAEVDALLPCEWSVDVFEPPEGRSRWEYAEERLSTLRASLDCDVYGDLRLSSWYAGAVDYYFGPDTTVYASVGVTYADLGALTNVVEIEADYRFPRLKQQIERYGWSHPGADGFSGLPGFCAWRPDSSELPDIDMVRAATEGAGQVMVNASFSRLPPTSPDPCGTGVAWINTYTELILGGTWGGARRWVQTVTERYALRLEAPASIADVGEVIARDGSAVEIESDIADRWEGSLGNRPAGATSEDVEDSEHSDDLRDEARRQLFLRCLLQQGVTTIVRAHNATQLSWAVPTSLVLGLDLGATLELDDQGVKAVGRCCRLEDRFNKDTGEAMTTVTIAVMRGGGDVADPLDPPPFPVDPQPEPPGVTPSMSLPTQLGGRDDSGEYDEDKDGFSGNYDNFDATYERFPRRFSVTAPEIPAEERDERIQQVGQTYRVSIPNDLLEL